MNLLSYRLLINLAAPLIAYSAWKRCKNHNQQKQSNPDLPEIKDCFKSRYGLNKQKYQTGGIWIHAVSVGETRSIFPLLSELHNQHPDLALTVTSGSTQGAVQALRFAPVKIQHQMLPYDYPSAINRFLDQIQPKLVIMVETEIWPNLYNACKQRNIPIVLINARLKQASFKAYQKWGGSIIKNALNQTEFISAQFPADAKNFIELGADASKVKTLGNLKFDLEINANIDQQAKLWKTENQLSKRPIWVAASTHAHPQDSNPENSEEQLIINAHKQLLAEFPNALLILVPRHADRFNEVATILENNGVNWKQRSQNQIIDTDTQVYLADTVGELMLWFAAADIAFIGGSLVPFGGHNILEPAALHKPVLSGPHYANLKSLFEPFVESHSIEIIEDSNQLAETLTELLQQPQKAEQLANKSFQQFSQQSGALQRILEAIKPLLN